MKKVLKQHLKSIFFDLSIAISICILSLSLLGFKNTDIDGKHCSHFDISSETIPFSNDPDSTEELIS